MDKKIEAIRCELTFGNYEYDEDEDLSWVNPQFRYRVEMTFRDLEDTNVESWTKELLMLIAENCKRFKHDYEIKKKYGSHTRNMGSKDTDILR